MFNKVPIGHRFQCENSHALFKKILNKYRNNNQKNWLVDTNLNYVLLIFFCEKNCCFVVCMNKIRIRR